MVEQSRQRKITIYVYVLFHFAPPVTNLVAVVTEIRSLGTGVVTMVTVTLENAKLSMHCIKLCGLLNSLYTVLV